MDGARPSKHCCGQGEVGFSYAGIIVSTEQQLILPAVGMRDGAAIVRAVRAALLESRAFRAAICMQLLASAVICGLAGRPMLAGLPAAYETFLSAAAVFGSMTLSVVLFRERWRAGTDRPALDAYRAAWRTLRAELITAEYVANVAIVLGTTPFAISAFSAAKQSIPLIRPFSWDARIAAAGAALYGGTHLWAVLQPLLAHPAVTVAMDWFYHRFWTAVMLGAFVGGTLLRPSVLRRRYLLAVVLLFLVVGTVGALAFASAGPAYYAQVVGSQSDPYQPLLAYLRSVNLNDGLLSVRGESSLWLAYTHRAQGFGLGVSAMPSMHVASATLTALFGFAIERRLGVLLALIAVCTWIASVGLGWHYSLDGLVGAALACCVWWIAGLAARRDTVAAK